MVSIKGCFSCIEIGTDVIGMAASIRAAMAPLKAASKKSAPFRSGWIAMEMLERG